MSNQQLPALNAMLEELYVPGKPVSSLRSDRSITITFDGVPEAWIRVYSECIDFAYKLGESPDKLISAVLAEFPNCELVDWSPGHLATIRFDRGDIDALPRILDSIIRSVFHFSQYRALGTVSLIHPA
jgi:hypothetical protein